MTDTKTSSQALLLSKREQAGVIFGATSAAMVEKLVSDKSITESVDGAVLVYGVIKFIAGRIDEYREALGKRIKAALEEAPKNDKGHRVISTSSGMATLQRRETVKFDHSAILALLDSRGIDRELVGETIFVLDEKKLESLVKQDILTSSDLQQCSRVTESFALVVTPNDRIPTMISGAMKLVGENTKLSSGDSSD